MEATRSLGGSAVSFVRFKLSVISGPSSGLSLEVEAPEIAIGTAPGNQVVLADPTVSRHHCSIEATEKGYLLRDLGSTNGTTLNGFRIEAAYLEAGAIVGAGSSKVRFDPLLEQTHLEVSSAAGFGRVLGASAAMRRVFALLPRLAASDSTILIEGETGTGKGLIADALHRSGARARGPFVAVDCASIPPSLIESELFGHEKGAFTGAVERRIGAFEAASGGTAFLDEIGELPLELQPKLLRVLEDRVVKRLGASETIKLDVRIIAATNRDLRREVNRGAFRSDLFYRLSTVQLRIPPLRERPEDIALLTSHFYAIFKGDLHPPAELLLAFVRHDWPGNVRELRSAVERATLLDDPMLWQQISEAPADAPAVDPADLELSFRAAKERAVARWERGYVEALLKKHGGNLSQAAREVKMDRNHLRELIKKRGVTAADD